MQDAWPALLLSLKVAAWATLITTLAGIGVGWALARLRFVGRELLDTLLTLPMVLPPTVLGYYLLVLLGPKGLVGGWWVQLTGDTLTFTFSGLVIASVIYSFPFVVQPLQSAFESVPKGLMEAAATLGAKPFDRFLTIAVPLAKRGFLTATVLGFAHTLGEFGVVLMVGGNIPGETRVISIAIYDHVEMLQYAEANRLSAILLVFAFSSMLLLFFTNRKKQVAT